MRQVTPPRPDKKFHATVRGGRTGGPCPHCQTILRFDQISGCPDSTPGCLAGHFGFVCPQCMAEFTEEEPTPKRTEMVILGPDDPGRPLLGGIVRESRRRLVVVRR